MYLAGLYTGIALSIAFFLWDEGKRNLFAILITALSWPFLLAYAVIDSLIENPK